MKNTKIISGIAAFAMILGPCVNYISAEEADTFIYGDLDGDGIPQLNDLTEMSLSLLGDKQLDEMQKKAADVNGDGGFDIADLSTMRQYIMHDNIKLGQVHNYTVDQDEFDISKCQLLSNSEDYRTDYDLFKLKNKGQFSMLIDSEDKFTEFKQFWEKGYKESVDNIESGFNVSADFFKENTLFVIARQEPRTAIKASITDIGLSKGGRISFEITSDNSEGDDNRESQTWMHAAAIPNKYLEGIDTSQIKITNKGTAVETDSILNCFDISTCDVLNCQISGEYIPEALEEKGAQMSAVIKSEEDFNNYNEKFNYRFSSSNDELRSYFGMSEKFFENNTLFIIPRTERSGSINNEATAIGINSDNKVYIEVTSTVPQIVTCDIATWQIAVAVPNRFIEGVDTTDFEVGFAIQNKKDAWRDDELDLYDCKLIDCPAPYYYNLDYQYDSDINPSLITSKEELYEYNSILKFMTDIVRPYSDNWEDMLEDNVMVSIDFSCPARYSVVEISVDENNKISVKLNYARPCVPIAEDDYKSHICFLVPRPYLRKSSAEPTLEVIRPDFN